MASISNYVQCISSLQNKYMVSPHTVSIETYTLCNGKCNFCPYKDLERIGLRMDTKTVYRLLDEIACFPEDRPVVINLSRVNEPFLDSRIFEFSKYINDKIPFGKMVFFTNGSVLSKEKISEIAKIKNINFLNISLMV